MPLPLQITPRYSAIDHRGGIAADIIGWNDLQGSIQAGGGAAGLTTEAYRDTPFVMSFFRSNQNDSLSFIYQMSHAWQPGTLLRPHIHVIPMANPVATQNVYIIGQYAWCSTTRALPANVGWTQITPVVVPVNPGDAFAEKLVDLTAGVGIQPPADIGESDLLLVYIQRNGVNVLDTYTTVKVGGTAAANLGLLSADVHYQTIKAGGSQSEFDG